MSYDFETTTHGKWILTGEHAVLRGHPALVFPLAHKTLTLRYKASNTPLQITYDGTYSKGCDTPTWKLIKTGLHALNQVSMPLTGTLNITNHVPIGAGMGASAALCVAITRWFQATLDSSINIFEFARMLEHDFHGQSSGLDIAGASADASRPAHGVYFQSGSVTSIASTWKPFWYLSYSGEPGITSKCIAQVQHLRENNHLRADELDTHMANSVQQACDALRSTTPDAIHQLADAIHQAHACFKAWGLINPALDTHMHDLIEVGALAVKPTGSGGGGYVLSLWENTPPPSISHELIAL